MVTNCIKQLLLKAVEHFKKKSFGST